VAEGDALEPRQVVVVIEAMKMQNEVQAPLAGTVTRIRCEAGARIEKGDVVVEYSPTAAE
jgi:biotin carboxyl carrier protein